MFQAVLRIRDVYPGSRIWISSIPDPNFSHPGSRIRIKEFKYFKPNFFLLNNRKYDPGCSFRIRIPDFYPSWIPDLGVKKAPVPRFRIRIRNKFSLQKFCIQMYVKAQNLYTYNRQ